MSTSLLCGIALALPVVSASAQLFSDDFNTAGSAANYGTPAVFGNNHLTWGYDYSAMGIPSAPGTTDGSTVGLKFESNHLSESAAVAGITLHTVQQFTGNYVVMFDMWMNLVGPLPGGGTGSTEFFTAGVGGDGVTVNRPGANAAFTGSGAWTGVSGDGGTTHDYRIFKGASTQSPAVTTWGAGTTTDSTSASNVYYAQFGNIDAAELPVQGANQPGGFASQTGVLKEGAVGLAWRSVELRVIDNEMTWYIDGLLIASVASAVTDGSVTIGYSDNFASFGDPATMFGVIDNLQVIPEPSTYALFAGLGILGLAIWRRARKSVS